MKKMKKIASAAFTSFGIALGVFGLTLSCSAEPSAYNYSVTDFGIGYDYSNSSKWYDDYSKNSSWYNNSWNYGQNYSSSYGTNNNWNDSYTYDWGNYESWDTGSDYTSDWSEDWNSGSDTDWYDYEEPYDWSDVWSDDLDDSYSDEWSEDWNADWSEDSTYDEYIYDAEYNADTEDYSDFYILSESDSRYYSEDELYNLSLDELTLARNEIYARHGRMFNRDEIREYFEAQAWYNGTVPPDSFSGSVLNDFEQANVLLIASMEAEYDDEECENEEVNTPSDDALIDAETEVLTKKAFTDSIKNDQVEIMVACNEIALDDDADNEYDEWKTEDAADDECATVYYDEYTGEECYKFEDVPEDITENETEEAESNESSENDETAEEENYSGNETETETDVNIEYFDDEACYDENADSYEAMFEYSEYETEEVSELEDNAESEKLIEEDASENVEYDDEDEAEYTEYDTETEAEYTEYNTEEASESEYIEETAENDEAYDSEDGSETEYTEEYTEGNAEYDAEGVSEFEDAAEDADYNTEDAGVTEETAEYTENDTEEWNESENATEDVDNGTENVNTDVNVNDYCFFMPIEESCYFDLDGDGAEDTITVNGYYSESSDGGTMINGFRLTINDQGCDLSGVYGIGSYCILNINETDGTLQVGLQYYIDDDYVKTSIYSYAYDGIHLLGEISGVFDGSVYDGIYPLATCNGDGILGSYRKLNLFQTWFAPTEWILRNGELAELVPSTYEPLDLFNGQGIDLKLMQGITVKRDDIDSEDAVNLPAGTAVHLTGTDNETWISMTADGYDGTFYLEVSDYDKVYVTDTGFLTSASLVFENMSKFA